MPTVRDIDLEMMRSPDRWPMWPYLPMKRGRGENRQIAFYVERLAGMYPEGGPHFEFYLGNMFLPSAATKLGYDTPEEILDEGWVVD